MDTYKEIRWQQRFINYEKSFKLLEKYTQQPITSDLEKAGIIQFFEVTFELAWKVLKDYLEANGYIVKSPREAIKQAFQIDLITNGHHWMDCLSKRNLTTHTYDEAFATQFVEEIKTIYTPLFKALYDTLAKEVA